MIGSGVSGVGAVKLLEAAGAVPTLYDSNEKLTEAEVRKRLPEGSKCKIVLGEFPENLKKETELVVLSRRAGGSAVGGGAAHERRSHLG